MKKVLVWTAVMLLVSGAAFAQTTGNLLLQGTVPGILEITVTAEDGADNLDLLTAVDNLAVATVVERSNKRAGYTVTLSSANASGSQAYFAGSAGNTDTLDYTISYGGEPVTLSSGTALISDISTKTSASGDAKTLAISYDGTGVFLAEDTYQDTLTLDIAAK
ncbi:hypothetical protein [Spirochaeta lutea]|uniref:Spore coat protein U domain-containing protein n=1 Tax=Spirochaeta lutea TaxID=1480694 RepID=A0A098QU92_9SPIO|nr:hypothetical protein [Spirochaeta lutea]KGE70958.1 hypothetical protein DC28_13545 [Spirochaeta lutea]